MKNKQNSTDWALIAKYLSGDTSDSETKEIESWIKLSKKNTQIFEEAKKNWLILGSFNNIENVNTNKAWKNLEYRLRKDNLIGNNDQYRVKTFSYLLRIAAIIIVSLGIGLGVYKIGLFNLNQEVVTTTNNDYNKKITLSDGTVVSLNSNTKISYLNNFNTETREVFLKSGEAFFQVAHNLNKPFVVITDKAEIRVLGTSFNVNLNTMKKGVEVFVEKGRVQLKDKNSENKKVLIDPGYIGALSKGEVSKLENKNENYLAWKTRYLVFKEEKLEQVINTLNKVYNVQITLSNQEISNCKLTTTFDKQSIDDIIEVICTTFQLKTEIKGSGIVIIGDECNKSEVK